MNAHFHLGDFVNVIPDCVTIFKIVDIRDINGANFYNVVNINDPSHMILDIAEMLLVTNQAPRDN